MGNTCTKSDATDATNANNGLGFNTTIKSFNYTSRRLPPDKTQNVTICKSVSIIEKAAFKYQTSLQSINMCHSVLEIENEAFHGCTNLRKINIPASMQSIEMGAFQDCTNLVEINVDASSCLRIIGDYVLSNCKSLKIITLPPSLVEIGEYAFFKCDNLQSVNMHPSSKIRTIKKSTFCDCMSLAQINIPETVTTILENAFRNCKSLKLLQLPKDIKNIETEAFSGCSSLAIMEIPSSMDKFEMNAFKDCSSLKFIKIDPSMAVCENSMFAFHRCSSLVSFSLPISMKSISMNSFEDCVSLFSVYIPASVQRIGDEAFKGCVMLTSIQLPSGVTVGRGAFRNCFALQKAFQLSTYYTEGSLTTYYDFMQYLKHRYANLPIHEACYHYQNESSLEQIEKVICEQAGEAGMLTENLISNDTYEMSPIHVLACNPNANMDTIGTVMNLFRCNEKPLLLKKMKTIRKNELLSPLQLYMKCRGISHISLIDVLKKGMPWIMIEELIEMQQSVSETIIADEANTEDSEDNPTAGMYPFMISAMQQGCDLETTYRLARSNVELLAT